MENRLKALFDLQRFEGNEELDNVIEKTHQRFRMSGSSPRALTDDDLGFVAAAGEKMPDQIKMEDEDVKKK